MIPLKVIEEHNEAFSVWFDAVADGTVPRGAVLIHVDHHDDMECGGYDHDFSIPVTTRQMAEDFVERSSGIADFIIPALWEGWFSSVVIVKSLLPENFKQEEQFIHHKGSGILLNGRVFPFVHGKYKGNPSSPYRFFTRWEGFGTPLEIDVPCVLDIDLDYFCWDNSLSTTDPKRMEITEEAYHQYCEDPHHPFRLFPRRLLRIVSEENRHYLEYKEYDITPPLADVQHIIKRVERLCNWLKENNIRPALIDICRSRYSGYTPSSRWKLVEDILLEHLEKLYPLQNEDSVTVWRVPAELGETDPLLERFSQFLEDIKCPAKAVTQLITAVEEIFVNIARYAYPSGGGEAVIRLWSKKREAQNTLYIQFEDSGIPYNPLERQDPDITLSAGEREMGGLGIYMAKKLTDNLEYEFVNGLNYLTMTKYL